MSVAPIDLMLSRLAKVRQRKPGQWSACCPAHEDRSPSLSVGETREGAVLVKCWAGCDIVAIVAAVGLDQADLFPPRDRQQRQGKAGTPRLLAASQAMELIRDESRIIAIVGADMVAGRSPSGIDAQRLRTAVSRISYLHAVCTGEDK